MCRQSSHYWRRNCQLYQCGGDIQSEYCWVVLCSLADLHLSYTHAFRSFSCQFTVQRMCNCWSILTSYYALFWKQLISISFLPYSENLVVLSRELYGLCVNISGSSLMDMSLSLSGELDLTIRKDWESCVSLVRHDVSLAETDYCQFSVKCVAAVKWRSADFALDNWLMCLNMTMSLLMQNNIITGSSTW